MNKKQVDKKDENTNNKKQIDKQEEQKQIKLGVFEEDDYFEEFEDGMFIYIIFNIIEKVNVLSQKSTDEKGFQQWQADWEDEEINDHFDEILKKELHIA